jgi:hypothetical protein
MIVPERGETVRVLDEGIDIGVGDCSTTVEQVVVFRAGGAGGAEVQRCIENIPGNHSEVLGNWAYVVEGL